jgi:hypothetical protein
VIWSCLIYFVVGMARDALATLWYRSVSESRALRAGGLGVGIEIFDVCILAFLIRAWSPALIVSYALGTGVGTFIIVKLSKEE